MQPVWPPRLVLLVPTPLSPWPIVNSIPKKPLKTSPATAWNMITVCAVHAASHSKEPSPAQTAWHEAWGDYTQLSGMIGTSRLICLAQTSTWTSWTKTLVLSLRHYNVASTQRHGQAHCNRKSNAPPRALFKCYTWALLSDSLSGDTGTPAEMCPYRLSLSQ